MPVCCLQKFDRQFSWRQRAGLLAMVKTIASEFVSDLPSCLEYSPRPLTAFNAKTELGRNQLSFETCRPYAKHSLSLIHCIYSMRMLRCPKAEPALQFLTGNVSGDRCAKNTRLRVTKPLFALKADAVSMEWLTVLDWKAKLYRKVFLQISTHAWICTQVAWQKVAA